VAVRKKRKPKFLTAGIPTAIGGNEPRGQAVFSLEKKRLRFLNGPAGREGRDLEGKLDAGVRHSSGS